MHGCGQYYFDRNYRCSEFRDKITEYFQEREEFFNKSSLAKQIVCALTKHALQ